jgi:hypothetical protein
VTAADKKHLLDLLTDTHAATQSTLKGIDLDMQVHLDSGWRARDIIGHLATWDREVAKSLNAFRMGSEYAIPKLDEDVFNQESVLEQRHLTHEQILDAWEQTHEEFKEAILEIPPDQFPGDLLYPWGEERGSIAQLVEYMVEHEVEHRDEIIQALEGSKTN